MDTTTIGSGSPEAEKTENLHTAVVVETSEPATPIAGKNTKKTPKKPKMQLPVEDEFAILLSQVSSCRQAGIDVRWTQLHPGNVVALVIPGAKLCPNNHLYISEKCNYCKD